MEALAATATGDLKRFQLAVSEGGGEGWGAAGDGGGGRKGGEEVMGNPHWDG